MSKPIEVREWIVTVDKKKMGPLFKKDLKAIEQAISGWSNEDKIRYRDQAASQGKITLKVEDGRQFEIPSSLFTIEEVKKTTSGTFLCPYYLILTFQVREYTPNVIEPSFGIGRILYSLIEHCFWVRSEDIDRCVSSFVNI